MELFLYIEHITIISQNENGVSIEQLTKDSEWKIIEVKYLTKTKRPVINKAIWVSKKIFKHDTKKGIIEVNFYWLKSEKKEDINWCWGYIYILDKYTNNVSTKWCLTTTINERIKLDKSDRRSRWRAECVIEKTKSD